MIDEILTEAGVQYRRARFQSPPKETYAIYSDNAQRDGADDVNLLTNHSITIELYEPKPDSSAEALIENALDKRGIVWERQDRYWLHDAQRYQVVYEFDYVEKKGVFLNA